MQQGIFVKGDSRSERYQSLLKPLQELINSEADFIANMANFSAVLKESFEFFWIGFYLVKEKELVLGPFQGSLACTRIPFGKGVCGAAWKQKSALIVPDVDLFPGHIACSALSKSEIVIPLIHENEVWAVLDIDSKFINDFDAVDLEFLQKLVSLIKK